MWIKRWSKSVLMLLAVGLVVALAACGGGADEQPSGEGTTENGQAGGGNGGTKNISIATTPVGSSTNSVGNGLASVISLNSDLQVSVQPFAGPTAYVDPLNNGEVMLAIQSAPDMIWAFRGEENYPDPIKNMRLLVRGNFIEVTGAAVRADSGIKTMKDLAGKRVSSEYSGATIGAAVLTAALEANGLSWDDVTPVPTVSYETGVNALRDNQTDAIFALVPTTPLMMDAHNAIGLASVPFLDDYTVDQIDEIPQEVLDKIREHVPGADFTIVEAAGYIQEDQIGIQYPNIFVASAHLSDEAAYTILETLWNHYEELHPIHAWLSTWTPEQMFDPDPEIPYHPGAVQFFKDQGLWNDETDRIQQELMEQAQ